MWENMGVREADEEVHECTQQRAEVLQGMQKKHLTKRTIKMSMRTHTSLAARDTNALKNYQMTQFSGVNIKRRVFYVLISLMHTTKSCWKQAT